MYSLLPISVILITLSLTAEHWPALLLLALVSHVALLLHNVPFSYIARRLKLFLPFVALFALSIPLSQGFAAGWQKAATIFLGSSVAFLATLWLTRTTSLARFTRFLSRIHAPAVLIQLIQFTARYIPLLYSELTSMLQARKARTFGSLPFRHRLTSTAQLTGMLTLRALSRAERTHRAMAARTFSDRQLH